MRGVRRRRGNLLAMTRKKEYIMTQKTLGAAFDIGTTTVVAHLIDLETGVRLATVSVSVSTGVRQKLHTPLSPGIYWRFVSAAGRSRWKC